ncbi:MAG: flagellin FliC [Rubrivivax sp.]|nr:flagellin FliC [Rubrivivax sp.]
MSLVINTNLVALNAQRSLGSSQSSLTTSMQRLSSGLRVNSAKDDAAGLAIAERMNAQVRGMAVAVRNANDGISLAQTAEGALGQVGDALQRMRELAVQARNASNSSSDRDSLNKEFGELAKEVQRVLGGTTFNGKAILGNDAGTQSFQIGAGVSADDQIDIATTDLAADATLTTVAGSNGNAPSGIGSAVSSAALGSVIADIDTAINTVNGERATLGASQSRFDSVISSLQIGTENPSAARSRIMDADFAAQTANLSRALILQQSGNAMVAQANLMSQSVLQLLQPR